MRQHSEYRARETVPDDPYFWWIGGKQPGDHIGQFRTNPHLLRIVENGYNGTPYSPRKRFLTFVLAPVVLVAVFMLAAIVLL